MQVNIPLEWDAISIINVTNILDYINDPVPDGAVIYTGDIPFQYSKNEACIQKFKVTQQETFSQLQARTIHSY